MNAPRRITQLDVARVAKVNRATVSLALRNHPSVPPQTRNRIKKIADKLGYRPDPMLSALAVYSNSQRQAGYRGTFAWIAHTTSEFRWRQLPHFAKYLEAAQARAQFHNYHLDVIDLGEEKLSLERITRILRSRGIHGLLVCPQPYPDTNFAALPWDVFSAVTFGYSVTRPLLHSVAPAQFRAAVRLTRELIARRYRRIGFAIGRAHDERTDHNYLGGYLSVTATTPTLEQIPPLFYDVAARNCGPVLVEWYRRYRPDVIVIGSPILFDTLVAAGIRVPDDVGVACPILSAADNHVSGVREANTRIGEAAVDMLVALFLRGERGSPGQPERLLIEGDWFEGKTLRPI